MDSPNRDERIDQNQFGKYYQGVGWKNPMKGKRNVEGLRQNAQRKRQEALDKVEQGIRQLLKQGKPINFNTVAQAADVSKAFLYKEPDIKERIEQLRQQGVKKKPEHKQRASDASKDAVIRTLRERLKKLEAEVRELRQQNVTAYGQVIEVNSLRQQLGRLQVENDHLRQKLGSAQDQISVIKTSGFEDKAMELGVQLNSTIRQAIRQAPQEVIEKALEALREASLKARVKNPSGFFYKAVTDAWKPNEDFKQKDEMDLFNKWWEVAKAGGLVVASSRNDGVLQVLTSEEQWVDFDEMLKVYPLDKF